MTDGHDDRIAIIGMAGRFPGAGSVDALWANLVAGRESLSYFDDEQLAAAGLDGPALRSRGRYVAARGVLEDADCFDAAFFGVHPKEAEVMDPQQRVFLEICWAALERAGYAPSRMPGAVGVFAGSTFNTYYLHALHQRQDLIELIGSDLVMFGNEKDYLTTRAAYKLGLKGPAVNVSTACSTSLVAVAQACQSLLTYQCDVALAGGSSVTVPQTRGYYHDDGGIGSADGHTRTFDAQSSGTAFGNGVAVVVLKRVADAIADGDQIYAVIAAAALNNDGAHRVSFGAPGVEGQSEVIAMAHALAGVDPETIAYVEAHGTATPLGDPIEVAALTKAFRLGTHARQFCAIGSVKTNLGHLDVTAGVTGLIKTALAIHHGVIPATLHFTQANPKLELESSPFYVNASLQPWPDRLGVPRRAGVSAFGTGGTNAHVILEEAPEVAPSGPSRGQQLLLLSAKTPEALDRATANLSRHLAEMAREETADGRAGADLADVAYTLQTGRSEFVHRRIVVCGDAAEGGSALDVRDPQRVFTHTQVRTNPPVVFMFPGQGTQYAGMGSALYGSEPAFRADVDRCADILAPLLDRDLRTLLLCAPDDARAAGELLMQTRYAQPALFIIEYAMAKLWMSWGIRPSAMIGHSVGEYVAGCLAGVFSLEAALSLVAKRGALVQAQPGGAMLAVRLPEQDVAPLLSGQMAIAAINAPSLCVVAGPYDAIAGLEARLAAQEVVTRRLHTSHAFHSPMMEPVVAPFTELVRQVVLGEPAIPYVSNVTAQWITPADAQSPEYWASHVRDSVRFADGLAELLKDPGNVLLEVGPGQTLATLARQHPLRAPDHVVLSSLPLSGDEELRGTLETLGRLWTSGVQVEWPSFYAAEHRRRVVLPTYPFERTRYWPEPAPVAAQSPTAMSTITAVNPVQSVQPEPLPQQGVAASRQERLQADVRALLQELSGYDLSGTDAATDLLELGLDSLLLTQAATLFQRKYGVSLTFRQLMEALSSVAAIAGYLDAHLAPDVSAPSLPQPEPVARPMAVPAAPIAPSSAGGVLDPALGQILLQQQQLTAQILQLMAGQPAAAPATAAVPAAPAPPPPAVPTPAASPSEQRAHGPFRPLDRGAGQALSATQSRALAALIERYTRRTNGSRRIAAANRPVLADPRSVAGFKQAWKDLVYPIVTTRSEGSRVWDVDGNEYVDFVMGFGASLFGHRPPFVVKAVHEQLDRGFEIGPIQPLAGEVAALIRELTGMERVGFTSTGSEAVLAATRVARTVTGRDRIAVFAGAYHGIFDEVLFRPATRNGAPGAAAIAPGIPATALGQVVVLDYGSPQALEYLRTFGSEIAAVLVEPVQSRRLDLQPKEFLHELRRVTEQTGSALVFDEVVTGFRVHPGGCQAHFGVRADLATYGKVIGGGLPIGVVTGVAKFMDALDGGQWQYGDTSFPEVGVTFFAGTFVRHPLALAAANAVARHLKDSGPDLQAQLTARTAQLAQELRAILAEFDAPYQLTQFSSLMHLTYPPDQKFAGLLYYFLKERGIHIWDNRTFVMTTAHREEDLRQLTRAFRESLAEMVAGELLPPPRNSSKSTPAGDAVQTQGGRTGETREAPAPAYAEAVASGPFPLTESQKEIWLAARMGGEAALAYNESLTLEFRGPFDVDLFRAAMGQVTARHPILLGRISDDGQWQELNVNARLDLPLTDLGGRPEERREGALATMIAADASEAFDLVSGPLVRVRIVRLDAERHVVIWTAHHVVCDGWSVGVILSELAAVYTALKNGERPALDTPASFRDYAVSCQERESAAHESLAYWRGRFAVMPPALDLPTDRLRPQVRSARASTARRTIDRGAHQAIKRVAGQLRTTQVVFLMAALKTLLYRLTGQSDLVVGLGAAGQALSGSSCLVGHCLNLLPIRTRLDPEASFQDNLAVVKKGVLDGYDHHDCTIGSLLQHLKVARSPSRAPLVEVLFNVDRDPGAVSFAGVELVCDRSAKQALHFDLFVNVVEGADGLSVQCDYNTDLFDAPTIERWLEYYERLLESVATRPSDSLDALAMLTPGEAHQLIAARNDTRADVPHSTVAEWFEGQAAADPDAVAVIVGDRELTYGDLDRRANQLARHLRARGVGPEVLVGLLVERSVDMVVALLGIAKAGGAYVPLDPSFPQDRLAHMVEDSRMPVLLTHKGLDRMLSRLPATVVRLDADWGQIAGRSGAVPEWPGPADDGLAYVLYTSGSTGKPKGVEIPHAALVNFLFSMQQEPGFATGDTLLAVTTLSFDIAGLEIYLPLVSGGRVVMASLDDAHDPHRLMALMDRFDCTVMQATPATWQALLEAGWRGSAHLKVLCGGEAFPQDLAEKLLPRCRELWNMYGPTETTIWSTVHHVRSVDGAIPIGHPIANTQVYVLDAGLRLRPVGAVGELYIGGAGLARGYLRRRELTQERFVASPFEEGQRLYRTGDLARWRPDGTLECLGRIDSQVKIRGFRIELGEVEAVLGRIESIGRCAVVAREDTPGDRRLVAYFEHPGEAPAIADLRAQLRKSLPDYMLPSAFVAMEALPLTPNGKIDRRALPPPGIAPGEDRADSGTPSDSLETALAAIWARVLRMPHVGVHDNFFELGGHSLGAVVLLSQIRKLTGRLLPLATLFQASTVAEFAALLRREGWMPSWSSLVPIQASGSKPPLFLVHGAEGNVLLYRALARELGTDQPVYGLQSQGLNGTSPAHASVAEMASEYVKEITTLQPDGPFFLGGYCLGGLIALEMAQQLREAGKDVELVMLLDTYNGAGLSRARSRLLAPLHLLQNVWFHLANVRYVSVDERRRFIRDKWDIARMRLRMRLDAAARLVTRARHDGRAPSHLAVKRINDRAADSYVPRPYRGRVALIRSTGDFVGLTSQSYGWAGWIEDGLEVHALPVYPRGMLVDPFSHVLARTVERCLRSWDTQPAAAPMNHVA